MYSEKEVKDKFIEDALIVRYLFGVNRMTQNEYVITMKELVEEYNNSIRFCKEMEANQLQVENQIRINHSLNGKG